MKTYNNYIDSNQDFLGKIPSHWSSTTLKRIAEVKDGTHDTPNYVEHGIPFITTKDLENGNVSFKNCKYISYEDYLSINKRSDVANGDIIMPMIGSIGSPIIVKTEQPFSIKNLALIKKNKDCDLRYIRYYLNSEATVFQFGLSISGGVQNFISLGVLRNLRIPKMNKDEQIAIANYLDHKSTQIDNLIAKKERLITLLQEEQTTIINQAVTKGLDSNVKMKDSGIEWLGKIPEHWEVKRIKHTTYVKGRIGWKGLRSDEFLEISDSYVVTGTDFKNGNVDWETCYQVPIDRYEDDPFIKLKNNDLLITKDGTIGKIAIVKNMPKIATLNSGIFLTRPKKEEYLQEFMYWVLFSDVFKTFYDFNKSGSTIQHLYQNVFNEFKYPLPEEKEQSDIVDFIKSKTLEIYEVISKTQQEIELLKEYKTALISEVVTGKVDVRDVVLN